MPRASSPLGRSTHHSTDIAPPKQRLQAKPAPRRARGGQTVNGGRLEGITRRFTFALTDRYGEQVGDEIAVEAQSPSSASSSSTPRHLPLHRTRPPSRAQAWSRLPRPVSPVTVGCADNGRDLEVRASSTRATADGAAFFDNTYVATGSATSVAKTVNGEGRLRESGLTTSSSRP